LTWRMIWQTARRRRSRRRARRHRSRRRASVWWCALQFSSAVQRVAGVAWLHATATSGPA
jgi:hypothetical protein